jgi:hypothetical protein
MNNVIYRNVLLPSSQAQDGETPTLLECCKENNAFVIWFSSYKEIKLVHWFSLYQRDEALEFAVEYARKERKKCKTTE